MASDSLFNFRTLSPAVRLDRMLRIERAAALALPFALAAAGALLLFAAGFLGGMLPDEVNARVLGAAILFASLSAALRVTGGFFVFLVHEAQGGLGFEAEAALAKASRGRELPDVPSSVLLSAVLNVRSVSGFALPRLLLSKRDVRKALAEGAVQDPSAEEALERANEIARKRGSERTEVHDLLLALAEKNPVLRDALVAADISLQDLERILAWERRLRARARTAREFWSREHLRKKGSIATNWSFGFSPILDRFSLDLTRMARDRGFPALIGHEREMEALERALSRQERTSALIVGERGSGQRRMLQELAARSLAGTTAPELRSRRVLSLDVARLLTAVPDPAAREAALEQAFREAATAGNIILAINDLHDFVSSPDAENRPGTIDLSAILAPYLEIPSFLFIGLTSYAGLHRYLEQVPGFVSRFSKIEVAEISEEEAFLVLEDLVSRLEQTSSIFISYPALREAVKLSGRYVQAVPFPQKAISLLDESLASVRQGRERVLLPRHVARVLAEQTQIPVGEVEGLEREKLLNLEDLIHQRLIDQEEAVSEIAAALRRARSEVATRKGPMGSFLFLGPTGVGKTETAKALAAIYFGSEERMIRLDMSEFQNLSDMERLLGTDRMPGLLTTPVRENPFSLVLFDELEKAHKNIINVLLQVLDEGHVTDGMGRKVSFQHTVIIATSNAGYRLILEAIKENKDFAALKEEVLALLFQEGVFRPELINRFDAFALYKPLSREDLVAIAGLMFAALQKNLQEQGVEFRASDALKARIADLGYDPRFGARNMRRVLQDRVENPLASALLRGEIARGDRISMNPETFEVQGEGT